MKNHFGVVNNIVVDKVVPADSVLAGATGMLDKVLIIGQGKDGLLYLASSHNIDESLRLAMAGIADLEWRKKQ